MSCPTFSLDKPRYNLSTYMGRFQHFVDLTDPRFLLYTDKDIQEAKVVLEEYKRTGLICQSNEYMWLQRKIYETAVHPVTKETIFPLFRVSAIAPVNIPIVYGMLACPPTNIPGTLFLHFINQSYNSACNYANRSGSTMSMKDISIAYTLAVSSACGFAYTLGRLTFLKHVQILIPLLATSIANISNVGFTRINEVIEGAPVFDQDGYCHGKSKTAGQIGVIQTALSRGILAPIACFLFPPLLMYPTTRLFPILKQQKRLGLGVELLFIYLSLQGALPAALAIFPQEYQLPVKYLEPQFHHLTRHTDGNKIDTLYGNKGL